MRSRAFAAVLVPALLVAAAPVAGPASPGADVLRGCSARPDSEGEDIEDWGVTLDGEMLYTWSRGDSRELQIQDLVEPKDVEMIQVICWAAVDRMYGVRLRHGISSVWTTNVFSGAADFLREAHDLRVEGGDIRSLPLPHPELILSVGAASQADDFVLALTHPKHQWMCRIGNVDLPSEIIRFQANDVLTLKAEHKKEKEEGGDEQRHHIVERAYGTYMRRFAIPFEPDPEKVEANFDNGVLKISIPRSPEAERQTRKIEIKSS